jgi:hypothetical protein
MNLRHNHFSKFLLFFFLVAGLNLVWSGSGWCAFSMSVDIRNISDNSSAAQVSWSGVTQTWKEADQYLVVNYFSDQSGWGVQIYTDNHNISAVPTYTGNTTAGYEGAGLVGVSYSDFFIPMAWTAQLDTSSPRPAITTSDVYFTLTSNNGYAYFKDPMQQVVGNNPFTPGDDYITLVNVNGLRTNLVAPWRISATSPIYVYLIGNFLGRPNQTYRTNQLVVELYHQ